MKNDNDKLNKELKVSNQIISNFTIIPNTNTGNNNLINNLNELLRIKNKEINDLKNELNNVSNIRNLVNFNDIMVINFISTDLIIRCGIKCLKTDKFYEVEQRLYRIYEDFRNKNKYFITGGKGVLRDKTIYENNIKDGDTIQLVINEE